MLLEPVALALAACYPLMKRVTQLPQVVLGAAFSWGMVMSFMAVQGQLPLLCWLLYGANLCWTVAYDTFYAMVDQADDEKIGVKSSARFFGRYTLWAIALLQLAMLALLEWAGSLAGLGQPFSIALVLALVNDISSPLAALADYAVPLLAGPEKAVAATKSYLCTLAAILQLVAHWKQDGALLGALTSLPQALQSVLAQPAQLQLPHLQQLRHCVVLGRAFGYAISREIALKIKEVCGIQAEAFSSAEFLHGPVSLLNQPLTLLNVALEDESAGAHQTQITEVKKRGAEVVTLQITLADIHPRLQPLLLMQRFYLDIEAVAVALGQNPDAPVGLNKVTSTL